MSEYIAQKILSWDSFVSKPKNVFTQNYHSMIKINVTDTLLENIRSNNGMLQIAVVDADTRYCGVYYGVCVVPKTQHQPNEPIIYVILWDNWKGYPLETGYVTILKNQPIPTYIKEFHKVLSNNLDCCFGE